MFFCWWTLKLTVLFLGTFSLTIFFLQTFGFPTFGLSLSYTFSLFFSCAFSLIFSHTFSLFFRCTLSFILWFRSCLSSRFIFLLRNLLSFRWLVLRWVSCLHFVILLVLFFILVLVSINIQDHFRIITNLNQLLSLLWNFLTFLALFLFIVPFIYT